MEQGTRPRTAVALQGGGALGAFECGVLEALYKSREGFRPAVLTGISIGAVNAAILGGAGIEALGQAWRERFSIPGPSSPFVSMPASFGPALAGSPLARLLQPLYEQAIPRLAQPYLSALGNEGMYRIRPEYLLAGPAAALFTDSLYDTTPLRHTLEEIVDPERLNRESRVVVTAVNVATGEGANFGNARAIQEGREGGGDNRFANDGEMSIDHILASGSIPPSFPPTKVGGGTFWDGGLYLNTPLSEAINCLERCDEGNPEVARELIVVELFPMLGTVPTNMQEVVSRLLNILFSSKLVLDEKLFAKVNSYIDMARRVDELLAKAREVPSLRDEAEALRGHEGYKELTGHRRITAFTKISLPPHPELANASDFSKASVEARIRAGYEAAMEQGIGSPHDL